MDMDKVTSDLGYCISAVGLMVDSSDNRSDDYDPNWVLGEVFAKLKAIKKEIDHDK